MVATFRRIVSHIPMMQTSTYIKHRSSCWKIYSSCESKTLLLNAYIKKYVRSYVSLKFWWFFFFLQISKFLSKKYNRQRWKNSFSFQLKREFFLSWEIHRSKNRCRSKIYNGKFSHLSFFFIRKLLGILGEYSYLYWLFIINSTVILKFLSNNMYVYFVSYSFFMYYNTNWKKKNGRNYSLTCTVLPTR